MNANDKIHVNWMPTEFSQLSIDELSESIFYKHFNYEKHSSSRQTYAFSSNVNIIYIYHD